jgi:molecular chaperone GrpE (heat shock protein)
MVDDPDLFWFGVVLMAGSIGLIVTQVGGGKRSPRSIPAPETIPAPLSPHASDPPPPPDPAPMQQAAAKELWTELAALRQQCDRLRQELQQQRSHLNQDFRDTTFAQLQTLLTSYPTARKMAEFQPDLPAKQLSALFTPLENWLQSWQIEPIGSAWDAVPYDPQLHQPDAADLQPGDLVYIRFIGYRQGNQILCPARVSRTLPHKTISTAP